MSGKFKFKAHYFLLSLIIFVIEILIALYAHDKFIRPYFGDFLVVILIYSFLRSFINASVIKLALSALIFSYIVEFAQYFDILTTFGLQQSGLARTLMGSSFEWTDLVAYTLGITVVLFVEKLIAYKVPTIQN